MEFPFTMEVNRQAMSNTIGNYVLPTSSPNSLPAPQMVIPKQLLNLQVNGIVYSGTPYIRFVGLSGALAVALGAYGAHSLLNKRIPGEHGKIAPEYEFTFSQERAELEDRKKVFETANRYHFLHTVALLGVPLSRRPRIVFGVMSLGMIVFCGTCYFDALTGNKSLRKYTPIGGSLLILGWICFIL